VRKGDIADLGLLAVPSIVGNAWQKRRRVNAVSGPIRLLTRVGRGCRPKAIGAPSPKNMKAQIARWKKLLK
jgi:hypothetical protein